MADKIKARARELQALAKCTVSYTTCRRLLLELGFDKAKEQLEAWVAKGDAEIAKLKTERPQ